MSKQALAIIQEEIDALQDRRADASFKAGWLKTSAGKNNAKTIKILERIYKNIERTPQ